jgi:hypothetical protein
VKRIPGNVFFRVDVGESRPINRSVASREAARSKTARIDIQAAPFVNQLLRAHDRPGDVQNVAAAPRPFVRPAGGVPLGRVHHSIQATSDIHIGNLR